MRNYTAFLKLFFGIDWQSILQSQIRNPIGWGLGHGCGNSSMLLIAQFDRELTIAHSSSMVNSA